MLAGQSSATELFLPRTGPVKDHALLHNTGCRLFEKIPSHKQKAVSKNQNPRVFTSGSCEFFSSNGSNRESEELCMGALVLVSVLVLSLQMQYEGHVRLGTGRRGLGPGRSPVHRSRSPKVVSGVFWSGNMRK